MKGQDTAADPLGEALGSARQGLAAVAVFSFCENLLMLAAPLYMMQVYDRVLGSRSTDTLVYLTIGLVIALATHGLLDLARGRVLARVALWLDQTLAPGLFERAVHGRLRGRRYGPEAFGDLATLRGFIASPGMTALFDLPWAAIFIATAYLLHPALGHLAFGSAAVLLALALIGEISTRRVVRLSGEAAMTARRDLDATVRNAEAIEAMGMMPAIAGRWARRNGEALALQARIMARSTLLASTTKFVRFLVQSLGLGLGAWLVIHQEATGGVMIASSILLSRALAPIEQSIGSWKSLLATRSALKRLRAFTAEPAFRGTGILLPRPRGELRAENLSMTAGPGEPPVLKGVSFTLPAGESLAVVGPSGAGKSTLARLLVGAVPPTAGQARLDGADLFAWRREQVGRFVGYLPQDVELFAGTVSENIARLTEADDEAVIAAARLADVHEMILRLPKGYATEIGEGGRHLSGGQRQRIALARAVFGAPRLVVLDEPNSNLDGDGEIALARAMAALKSAGCTVVVVTHRTALVQHVDKMLLLRDGQVEVFGPRAEVFARLVGQPQPPSARPAPQAHGGPLISIPLGA